MPRQAGSLKTEQLLLTYEALSRAISVSVPTLKRWKASGRIPCVQVGPAGVDLYAVQRMMRHKTSAMTQRYAHLNPGHLQAEALKISAAGEIARNPARKTGEKIGC